MQQVRLLFIADALACQSRDFDMAFRSVSGPDGVDM